MAVTAYCGVPGSGKSYEVVTEVIVPALRSGRRVVSNIAGLHYEEMRAYLIEEGSEPEKIGSLEMVTKEQIAAPAFWCADGKETLVRPGDLVVLDECWRWMASGVNIPPDMFAFLREHRHFVDANKVSCDIVLITQSLGDLDRKVKVIVEKHFVMEKLKRLGLTKQYTVDVYNGNRGTKASKIKRILRQYNKAFFCFYSSYDGAGGDEREVDKRINALRSPWVIAGLIAAPILFLGGAFSVYRIYTKHTEPEKKAAATHEPGASAAVNPGSGALVPVSPARPGMDESWRIVGYYSVGPSGVFMMQSGEHVRYVYAPAAYRVGMLNIEVGIDDKLYSSYGGGSPAGGVGGIVGAKREH
jgi:zona occludens toxin